MRFYPFQVDDFLAWVLVFEGIRAVCWMFNQQKNRRNWNEWQEFEAVKKLKEVLAEIGKKTQGQRTDLLSIVDKKSDLLSIVDKRLESVSHNTRKAIAEKIGWSTGKVAMAEVVAKNAPENIITAVKSGEMSINLAYQATSLPAQVAFINS